MVFGFIPAGDGILAQIYMVVGIFSFLIFPLLIIFGPKLMVWQTDRKVRDAMVDLDAYRNDAKTMFLSNLVEKPSDSLEQKFETLRDFKFSPPAGLDPAGMVGKLEHVLDSSENKFNRFIEANAEVEDEERLADLNMAFKGVMGTHQIYKVMRHFRQLIKKTGNFQLVSITMMMLPIYKELSESQREATRAFVDQAPIGDAIGPLVAAKLIDEEPEEVAEDIVHSEEEINEETVHVVKSKGPGARLGKYGNAIDSIADEEDLEAIITVDAGAKFEGEETGAISEGVGVMMGGPGVEKSKIEEAAEDHDVPLEGIIIKQSPPEASKPMKKEIYEAWQPAVEKVKEIAAEFDGPVAVVGVGNTCGVGNTEESSSDVPNRLSDYWEEYEEQDEEDVSYMGLMSAFPGGEQSLSLRDHANIFWRITRS